MFKNYLKTAFRRLVRNRASSFINIGGLALGMAVVMVIGLWIWDELSFNKYHKRYDRIVQIKQSQHLNNEVQTADKVPMPLAQELRNSYGSTFKNIVLSTTTLKRALSYGDKKFMKVGRFMESAGPEMLTLDMLKGTANGLKDPSSIMISKTVAKAFFGNEDPINKIIKIDTRLITKVTGVYKDIPHNSEFADMEFVAPWTLYISSEEWLKAAQQQWDNNSALIYAELHHYQADVEKVSQLIRDTRLNNSSEDMKRFRPAVFVYPMSRWHLYSEFKNGVNVGGRIQFVRLFCIIGIFVFILACINFMNLSTAQSEKRAKEIGVRKSIGSLRKHLIQQFISESLLVAVFSFLLSLLIVQFSLPWFNRVADKDMFISWGNPWFWVLGISFTCITGLIAGSYPALYLSSFNPIKALKGTFRAGKLAAIPRKTLVVVQFSVSIILIIGTVIVFRQIQYGKDRPVGYSRNGLLAIDLASINIHDHFSAIRTDLLKSGMVLEMSESSSLTTEVWNEQTGFEWKDKPPGLTENFITVGVNHEYGKTVGWEFIQGRDFSREFATDSLGFVINESAARFMGFKDPIGETVKWSGANFKIIGVINDMVIKSPFEPVLPTVFILAPGQ